jgi:transcription elongation GreA/GreB family factor
MPNKIQIVNTIISALVDKRQQAITAANQAHAAAVDDQSVAETQYDTLAIEASYLAEGQSKRVNEYQQAIDAFTQLKLALTIGNIHSINLGSLVQLSVVTKPNDWFFIGPAAGGFQTQIAGQHITVITPNSPMGKALIGKQQDDDIEVLIGLKKIDAYVAITK